MNLILQIETLGVVCGSLLLLVEEVRRVGRLITPLTLMVVPFQVILLLMNFLLIYHGYPAITEKVMVFLLVQFVLFWLLGKIIYEMAGKPQNLDFDYSSLEHQLNRFTPVYMGVAVLSALFIIFKALMLLKSHGGITYYAHPHYEKFMNRGFSAHLIQLAKVNLFLLIITYRPSRHKWLIWIVTAIVLVALALVQVKYHILHLLLIGLLYFSLNRSIKDQFKILATAAILLFVIFNVFLFLVAKAAGITDTRILTQAVQRYSVNYLASGTISLDIWMAHSNVMPEWAPIVTMKNIVNAILGNPYRYNLVRVVSLDFMDVGPGLITNVGTAFGPFFLIGGWPLAWAYTIFSSFLFYNVYFAAAKRKHILLVFLNLLFLTFSTFTFFVQYVLLLSTFEMPILLILLVGSLQSGYWIWRVISKQEIKHHALGHHHT